jgi:hypothetical protein
MTGSQMAANRVKPPPPGMAGGILGNAFARGSRLRFRSSPGGRPGTLTPPTPASPALTAGRPQVSFTTPRQELHPYDDGH